MKKIKFPSTTILILGGLGAFWLAQIANPGFNPIGIMIFLLIPILIYEVLYPESELDKLYDPGKPVSTEDEEPVGEKLSSSELVSEDTA
ncbi:MAG: hypothetical protein L3J59_06845 [Methylococcaceae bacterium]|nr:hypothetical protein [Methylococcaceae bacterium]